MMEQLQENRLASDKVANTTHATQGEQSPEQPVISVGHLLREGRERMGWSIEDVVNQIKLAPRQIIALEADDFQSLPETAFVRGFVRSYAKVLQMDAQTLLDALPGAQVSRAKVDALGAKPTFPEGSPERRQNLNLLIGAFFIALLIVGFAIWQANVPQQPVIEQVKTVATGALVTTPVELPVQPEIMVGSDVAAADALAASAVLPVSAVPDAAVVQPAQAVAAPVTEGKAVASVSKLRLVFDNESWTEITEQSGKVLTRKVYQPGEVLNVEGVAPFGLVIGHAPKVHLYYQGKLVDTTPHIDASSDVARFTLK